MLLSRLQGAGITSMGEEQAEHALAWHPNDIDKAYDLLVLANESLEGELKDFSPDVTMLGAINRNMVTCYLDALLFAMFARLDSFEAMLYDNFEDEPRKKLAAVLRLWVNLLRSGQLIKVDLVQPTQSSDAFIANPCHRQSTSKTRSPSVDGKTLPRFANKTLRKLLPSLLVHSSCPYLLSKWTSTTRDVKTKKMITSLSTNGCSKSPSQNKRVIMSLHWKTVWKPISTTGSRSSDICNGRIQ
jgi:hypothetical protein